MAVFKNQHSYKFFIEHVTTKAACPIMFETKRCQLKKFIFNLYLNKNSLPYHQFDFYVSFTGKIGLFYLVFYGVLAALVAICFWGFFQTLDPRIPRWQLERSIIGTNPGNPYFLLALKTQYHNISS